MSFLKKKSKAFLTAATISVSAALLLSGCSANNSESDSTSQESPSNVSSLKIPGLATTIGAFPVDSSGSAIKIDEVNESIPRVEIIFDLHCPACKMVEENSSETFTTMIENNEAQFWFTPVSFLDRGSSDDYSSRAASALVEVAENSPEHFYDFFKSLYANQPIEGPGYTEFNNEKLAKVAEKVGVSKEVTKLFPEERYKQWVLENTKVVSERTDVLPNGLSTPTIVMGGSFDGLTLQGHETVVFEDAETDRAVVETFEKIKK